MQGIADRFRLSLDKLRALSALNARPVTERFFLILRSVFLDLTAAICASAVLVAVLLLGELLPVVYVAPLAVLLGAGIYGWMKTSRVVDPEGPLRKGAARVAELFPARFIIMGHTHDPVMEPVTEGVTYINLGAWAVDDVDNEGLLSQPPCTHAVIRHVDGKPHAELRRWCSEQGPSTVHASVPEAQQSGVHARPKQADEQVA
jgi:hypothetical protein